MCPPPVADLHIPKQIHAPCIEKLDFTHLRVWTRAVYFFPHRIILFMFILCQAANLRMGIYNGEMVFNRLLGNSWSDLDDFFSTPP